jgi:endonuclease G
MRSSSKFLAFIALSLLVISCRKETAYEPESMQKDRQSTSATITNRSASNFPESFESGIKTSYTTGNVVLSSGSWNFNDARIGDATGDRKTGAKSARMQNSGMLTMNFDVPNGASSVSFFHARYNREANGNVELWASINGGTSWIQVGNTISVTSFTLTKATFFTNFTGPVRFQVRKKDGGRINIDDFDIQENIGGPTQDNNLSMGNPTAAITDIASPNNYLMVKNQYALSYNNGRGSANWVGWHLSTAWKGLAPRCDCFAADNTLPTGFYKAATSSYTNTGFDRGHMCPSEDRDLNTTDNAATFLMTNMMPQSPNLNRVTWVALENYCRTLMDSGNELYIMSGGYGAGGTDSNGGVTSTIASGKIAVPASCWKLIVVLPVGSDDVNRVTTTTRVIAVSMPNTQTVNSQPWGNYRVSVDDLEATLGYDFLSNVSPAIQAAIEANADNGPL